MLGSECRDLALNGIPSRRCHRRDAKNRVAPHRIIGAKRLRAGGVRRTFFAMRNQCHDSRGVALSDVTFEQARNGGDVSRYFAAYATHQPAGSIGPETMLHVPGLPWALAAR